MTTLRSCHERVLIIAELGYIGKTAGDVMLTLSTCVQDTCCRENIRIRELASQ